MVLLVQISRMPPESPVRMSPLLRKVKHWMNFGFSYFCNSSRTDGQVSQTDNQTQPVNYSVGQSDRQTAGLSWSKLQSYPEDPLFAGQRVSRPGPKEDVGLSAGHDGVWVGGMELHSQDHLIGALKGMGTLKSVSGQSEQRRRDEWRPSP